MVHDERMNKTLYVGGAFHNPVTLVGVSEIARHFGVAKTNVTTWISRREKNGFPKPVIQLDMGGVYVLKDVEDWRGSR